MERNRMHRIPHKDPVSGGELYISELTSEETGITIRGNFEIPRYAKLDTEMLDFLEVFLRCRGMLNGVERELGISYPTARARLDTLLGALNLSPIEARERTDKNADKRKKILEQLEKGEITADEAKKKLGVLS
ncbi:MAG: DUF2089 domain-containing protein [Fimbriimonas sp.]|nr:DUF2089 domain-containing protein [Fimbriimonas sp.]